MPRKPRKGYFVQGQFVTEGSDLDQQLKEEQRAGGPSKTELKAQSAQLQTLGEQLLGLRTNLLRPLGLPERLLDALDELKRIESFEGKRRQSQFVGKLMRQLPGETIAHIRGALDEQRQGAAQQVLRLHAAEHWRERLLDDDAAAAAWAIQFPGTDVQHLRALVRQARKQAPPPEVVREATASGQAPRHGRAWRELFQFVQAELARAESAGADSDDPAHYTDDTRAG